MTRRRRRGWVVDGKGKCGTEKKKHPPSLAKAKRSVEWKCVDRRSEASPKTLPPFTLALICLIAITCLRFL